MTLRRGKRHYTADQFEKIAALAHNEDRRVELENGVVVNIGSAGVYNSVTAARIATFLGEVVYSRKLGYLLSAKALFKLGPDCVRCPNVSFVSHSQAATIKELELVTVPDLAVEVAMPDEDVLKKSREYCAAGTRVIWVVYTDNKTVEVITPAERGEMRVRRLKVDDTLDGSDVLPGFSLSVAEIFPTI